MSVLCLSRSPLRRAALGLLLSLAPAAVAAADEPAPVKVGDNAPAFTLKDQDGKDRSLDGLLKKGKVALVFYRSADWWPFCRKQLVQLQGEIKAIEAAGVQVVGVSYDDVPVLKAFADKSRITFPLLSDKESRTIRAFGILDPKGNGYPHPETYLVDQSGVVRARLDREGFRERHTPAELIEAAKKAE